MLFLMLIPCVLSKLHKTIAPGVKETYYAILGEKDIELTVQLDQLSEMPVYYSILKPGEMMLEDEEGTQMSKFVNEKYTKSGMYRINVHNTGPERALVSVHTNVMKTDNVNNDHLEIKNLFIDLEARLTSLYNTNMRLKMIQEKNIMEARKMRRGLYIMFVIPLLYVGIGFAKLHGIKMMFAPKRGTKI